MNVKKQNIDFANTNQFSKLVLDYIAKDESLKNFITDFPNVEAIGRQIETRRNQVTDRKLLQSVLQKQYQGLTLNNAVRRHIELITDENTFTVCTAHQPVIFTGPLYFIYKIAHTIALARKCKELFPACNFVPVFYLGSEDHDLDEIGKFFLGDKELQWNTTQKGACGRMTTTDLSSVTEEVVAILNNEVEAENWLKELVQKAYGHDHTLSMATRLFVNGLFEQYGLLIIDGDDQQLKRSFAPVIMKELLQRASSGKVIETAEALSLQYKVQTTGREINLFYLEDQLRERIEYKDGLWLVVNSDIKFNESELLRELELYPERFSPNVILRPVYQEWILPNILFTGGGGELAYWIELKNVFALYDVPFPLLFLRNSFLLIDQQVAELLQKISLTPEELFLPEDALFKNIFSENETMRSLKNMADRIDNSLNGIKDLGSSIDINLVRSLEAHKAKINRITARIAQKFIAHLKKKEQLQTDNIKKIKGHLFPAGKLQERQDNLLTWYKVFGREMIDMLVDAQQGLDAEFIILTAD